MRYPKDHKSTSRQRIVEMSGSHAKKHGFADSGMATLAASAGVTTGALYKHFGGKADLFAALVAAEMARTARMFAALDPTDASGTAQSLAGYLSLQHVRHPEQGCPLPSLTAEVARGDDAVKSAFRTGLLDIHAQLSRLTGSSDGAWALMARNVGAVMLARAVPDEALQRVILSAARDAGQSRVSARKKSPPARGPGPRQRAAPGRAAENPPETP